MGFKMYQKKGPATANVGESITYIIEVTNESIFPITNITVTDELPYDFWISLYQPIWRCGTITYDENYRDAWTVEWIIPQLDPAEAKNIKYYRGNLTTWGTNENSANANDGASDYPSNTVTTVV